MVAGGTQNTTEMSPEGAGGKAANGQDVSGVKGYIFWARPKATAVKVLAIAEFYIQLRYSCIFGARELRNDSYSSGEAQKNLNRNPAKNKKAILP